MSNSKPTSGPKVDQNGPKMSATDVFAMRLKICKRCDKQDCTKGAFGAPPPNDCPFSLEHLVHGQK